MPEIKVEKPKAIIIDFPQTTRRSGFKERVLVPHFKKHFGKYLKDNWTSMELLDIIRQMRIQSEQTHGENNECPVIAKRTAPQNEIIKSVIKYVNWLGDNETPAIKRLRDKMWRNDLENGNLKYEFYGDVPVALQYWRQSKIKVYTISSLSDAEQKFELDHSNFGQFSGLIDFYGDPRVGLKKEVSTYKIFLVKIIRSPPENVLFITDYIEHAKAAMEAGLKVGIISRETEVNTDDLKVYKIEALTDFHFRSS